MGAVGGDFFQKLEFWDHLFGGPGTWECFFLFSSWERAEHSQHSVSPSWVLPWLWQADALTIFLHTHTHKNALRKNKSLAANSENPDPCPSQHGIHPVLHAQNPSPAEQKEAEQKKIRFCPQYVKQNSSN